MTKKTEKKINSGACKILGLWTKAINLRLDYIHVGQLANCN